MGIGLLLILIALFIAVLAIRGTYRVLPPFNKIGGSQPDNPPPEKLTAGILQSLG